MKFWSQTSFALLCSQLVSHISFTLADNPIIQGVFTADPAPIVHEGRLYLFTSHDEDTAQNWYDMRDWRLFSTTDMVNYREHAVPMSLKNFPWATKDAWAGQVVPRNGKFYYYVPIGNGTWPSFAIGVGVSDNIEGPYVDAIGGPLLANGGIDPTVFIDDDGQAYMYWGNPILYYVKLNSDMLSYSGGIQTVNLTTEGFGNGGRGFPTMYNEGPWFYRRNNLYYLVYSSLCCPQNIQYSTAPGPLGPWTHRGVIMNTGQSPADTNHVGLVNYKGKDYFYYHTRGLPGGNSFRRSTCVESFNYLPDGRIPNIGMSQNGPPQIENFDPYLFHEAETMSYSEGIKTESRDGKVLVAFINNGDYVKVSGVDFKTGASKFAATVASAKQGGSIEIRLDSVWGPVVGTVPVTNTGGWGNYTTVETPITNANGVHDLFFKFIGVGNDYLFNFDSWQFTLDDSVIPPVDNTCRQQPVTNGPRTSNPDTPEAFVANPVYRDAAQSAITPNGYTNVFTGLGASSRQDGFLSVRTLNTYSPTECARLCNASAKCRSFNIFFSRGPTLGPAPKCPNPVSQTAIRCALYSAPLAQDKVTNVGQFSEKFRTAFAGSSGYNKL